MSTHALGPQHVIIQFPPSDSGDSTEMFENAKIIAAIPARWPLHPSYMHTFGKKKKIVQSNYKNIVLGVTENYFIVVEQPLSLSVPAIVTNKLIRNEPLAGCFRWYHEEYVKYCSTNFNCPTTTPHSRLK